MSTSATAQQLVSSLYSAASILVESVTDPEVIADAPLRHRVAALSAVSQLIATLHKFAAAHPEALTSAPATPQVPAPEPVIEKSMETESIAAQPPRQPAQPAAPRIPAISDDYDGWRTADETRDLEHMQRLAAQAYANGDDYAGRFLDPANDPALRLTPRSQPVRAR